MVRTADPTWLLIIVCIHMAIRYDLVEYEINKTCWRNLREESGCAICVPRRLRRLIYTACPESAEAAFVKLDNHIVVQGGIFDSAVHAVPVLFAALAYEIPDYVGRWILELLYQILNGTTDSSEYERGLRNLEEKCKHAAEPSLWLMYRYVFVNRSSLAREIVKIIDLDIDRRKIVDAVVCDEST